MINPALLVAAFGVAVYFLFIKGKSADAPSPEVGRDGIDAIDGTRPPEPTKKSFLARLTGPKQLPKVTVCVPKFNRPSHESGRAPWAANSDPNKECSKARPVRGVSVPVPGTDIPLFLAWTGDFFCFNFHRIKDADPDVAFFVSDKERNVRAAYNFKTRAWLPNDRITVEKNQAGDLGKADTNNSYVPPYGGASKARLFNENYDTERSNFLSRRHIQPKL